ncbi:MAG: acyloxyacyl hydrolase [Sphingomonas sp.]|nr:acyloxyacyl hydrolase [Sphingomonas sp.]
MNKIIAMLAALSASVLHPASTHAQEVFGGIYAHAVGTKLSLGSSRESGVDFQIGYRGGNIIRGTKLQPYVLGALNSKGDTSYAAAGLSWKFGDRFYVRPGLGVAIHNGSTEDFVLDDRIAFGSRLLIESEVGVGARINERLTIEASLVHLSHGQIFGGQNPGIDNIGVRLNLEL